MNAMQTAAMVLVFITNGLVLAGLAYLVFRIQHATEQMHATLAVSAQDLLEAGRGLRGLGGGVDRLIERMGAAERQVSAVVRVTADSLAAMDARLRQTLEATLSDLAASGELGDTQLHGDVRRLLDSLGQVLPGGVGGWAEHHRDELAQVMGQSEVLLAENQRLHDRVGELRSQLDGLRSVQRAQQAADQEIDSLHQALVQQQQLVARLRNEAREAGHRAGAAEAALLQARSEGEQLRGDGVQQAAHSDEVQQRAQALAEELAALRIEHERLKSAHERQREQLARLTIEKEFIEDKYLGLDEGAPVTG